VKQKTANFNDQPFHRMSHSKRWVASQRSPIYAASILFTIFWAVIPFTLNNIHSLKGGRDFNESGLSRKAWCKQHHLSISAFGYWLKKPSADCTDYELSADPVFARLPSEQEIYFSNLTNRHLSRSFWLIVFVLKLLRIVNLS
jgi:hypothetical protein